MYTCIRIHAYIHPYVQSCILIHTNRREIYSESPSLHSSSFVRNRQLLLRSLPVHLLAGRPVRGEEGDGAAQGEHRAAQNRVHAQHDGADRRGRSGDVRQTSRQVGVERRRGQSVRQRATARMIVVTPRVFSIFFAELSVAG